MTRIRATRDVQIFNNAQSATSQRHIVSVDPVEETGIPGWHSLDVPNASVDRRKQSRWMDLKRQELLMVRGNPSNCKQTGPSSISLTFSPHRQARAQRACIITTHTYLNLPFFRFNVNSFEIYSSGGTWPYTTHHASFFLPNSR